MNICGLYCKETANIKPQKNGFILALAVLLLFFCSQSVSALPYFPSADTKTKTKSFSLDSRKERSKTSFIFDKDTKEDKLFASLWDEDKFKKEAKFLLPKKIAKVLEEPKKLITTEHSFDTLWTRDWPRCEDDDDDYSIVSEPGTMSMMGLGLAALMLFRQRRIASGQV